MDSEDEFARFEHEDWERVADKYHSAWSSWHVPTAEYFFEVERDAGVRTAGLLARQTPETLKAIQSEVEHAVQRYGKGDRFAIPMAAHLIVVSKP